MVFQGYRIRSFVRRQGRMSPRQREALSRLYEQYAVPVEQGMLNFTELFGRKAPVIMEIGFGMGQALVAMAKAKPDHDFIGIEVHRPGVGTLLADIEEQGVSNVRVCCADCNDVLRNCIPDASLSGIYLFFPDPWPKQRHHKRRLVQESFVNLVSEKLEPKGQFHTATDWEDYADYMMKVLSANSVLKNVAGKRKFAPRPAHRLITKFEKRGKRLGHGVWDLVFEKVVN